MQFHIVSQQHQRAKSLLVQLAVLDKTLTHKPTHKPAAIIPYISIILMELVTDREPLEKNIFILDAIGGTQRPSVTLGRKQRP